MSGSEIRRSKPLFPIGIVIELTGLTARQIRYYEENKLITPARTKGNRRMFSLDDIDRLLEIRDLIDQGVNLAGIKKILPAQKQVRLKEEHEKQGNRSGKDLPDEELKRLLRTELIHAGRFNRTSLRQGDLSRFLNKMN